MDIKVRYAEKIADWRLVGLANDRERAPVN